MSTADRCRPLGSPPGRGVAAQRRPSRPHFGSGSCRSFGAASEFGPQLWLRAVQWSQLNALSQGSQRGGALLRTSVMATHEREVLDQALSIFERLKGSVENLEPPV